MRRALRGGPSCPGCELGSSKRRAPSGREGRVSREGQWARLRGRGGDSRCPGHTGQHVCPGRCPPPCKPSRVTSCFVPPVPPIERHSRASQSPASSCTWCGRCRASGETLTEPRGARSRPCRHRACACPGVGGDERAEAQGPPRGAASVSPSPPQKGHARPSAPAAAIPPPSPATRQTPPTPRTAARPRALPRSLLRTDGRRHAADGGLVFVGRFTPEPHSTPLSSPHFTAEETGAPRSAHSCLKAQPAPVPILWSGPLCSPASSGVSRPRSHPCFGERCWAAGSALGRFCIISTRRDPAPQHLLGAQHAALRTLSLWPTLPSMTGI